MNGLNSSSFDVGKDGPSMSVVFEEKKNRSKLAESKDKLKKLPHHHQNLKLDLF